MYVSGKFLSATAWTDKTRLFRSRDSYHVVRISHSRTKLFLNPAILHVLPDQLRCGKVIVLSSDICGAVHAPLRA